MTVRGMAAAAAGVVLVASSAGCGPTIFDLPRPGGGVAGPSYRIVAVFDDALNLPDGAHVRVGGVQVGRVQRITTRDFVARVELRLPQRIRLTEAATAELRLTTPLGEGFIDLDPGKGARTLADGAVIDRAATSTAASVEDMLAAASVLITGGGLEQIRTIAVELQKVLEGPKGNPAKLFRSLEGTLSLLDERTGDIEATLDALDTLTGTLLDRRATLRSALAEIAPAAKLLADQSEEFSELLARVAELGRVGDRVVRATRADLIALLRSAQPVLDALISIENSVGPTLAQLIKFGRFLDDSVPGDYVAGDAEVSNSTFGVPGTAAPSLREMWEGRG